MVNPNEQLELDPDLEDILSMWGKEPTVQNVEQFFGAYELSRLASLSQAEIPSFSHHSKFPGREPFSCRDQEVFKQVERETAVDGSSNGAHISGIKGKYVLRQNLPSKGFEDIANLGFSSGIGKAKGFGGSLPLSRVSLSRIPPLSKESPARGSEGPADVLVGAQDGFGDPHAEYLLSGNPTHGSSAHAQNTTGVGSPGPPLQEDLAGFGGHGAPRVSVGELRRTGEKRKPQRLIGYQEIEGNIILGMEVSIEESIEVVDCALVGRARGKKFSLDFLKKWGEQHFVSDRPLRFEAQCLAKGWFLFRFEDKEAADWVRERNWFIGNIPVLMKPWSPLFDAIKERTDVFPVWVSAPGLPSFLWTEAVFKTIGNTLGYFLEADMSFLETKDRAMARILVSLNPSRGLAQKVNLQYKDYVFEQLLDYEHLPFRCHICHEYGHLAKDCPLYKRRRRFRRTTAYREPVFEQARSPQTNEGLGRQPSDDMEIEGTQNTPAPKVNKSHEAAEIPGSIPAEAEEEIAKDNPAEEPQSIDHEIGMCSGPPLSPHLAPEHTSVSMQCSPAFPPPHDEGPNETIDPSSLSPDINSISAAMPSLDLNCEDAWPPLVPPVPHTQCPYNLRSLGGKSGKPGVVGGLGQSTSQGSAKNKRGRQSHLSKAKLKAKLDVADGKQYSIPGVLRAVQPHDYVVK